MKILAEDRRRNVSKPDQRKCQAARRALESATPKSSVPPTVAASLLCDLRRGLVRLADTRPDRTASIADLDLVYARLAGQRMRAAVAEGTAFSSAHWSRYEGGWRLRESTETP